MQLHDLASPDGPFWAAWQAYRQREDVTGGPSHVPAWFLAKTARARMSAARVAVEQIAHPLGSELWEALRIVEQFIREIDLLDPVAEQVVAGLLGAQEIETERELREAGR